MFCHFLLGRGRGRGMGRGRGRGRYNDNYGGTDLVNEYGGYDDGDLDAPTQPAQGRGKASSIKSLILFLIFYFKAYMNKFNADAIFVWVWLLFLSI
jgi:hypothetical protein